MAAPNSKPVTTARERNWAIQPILKTAMTRKSRLEARVIVATKEATSSVPVSLAAKTAPAATA